MRPRARLAAPIAAIVAILALAPLLGVPAFAAATGSATATEAAAGTGIAAAASGPKVVIVVGATHEATDSYRTYANQMYAEAIKYTPNVVKVYSPNATWKNVKAAAQGASILIYLGHGSGYPRDDKAVFNPDGHDGMGLNVASNKSDYVVKYYGESYMANDIRLARNAVVILSHLCFASGNSMSGDPEPSYAVAQQRIDNFASGFIRAGARTVIADVWNSGVTHYIQSIFTLNQTMGQVWTASPSNHNHRMSFTPLRNPAYQAVMDPNTWTTGFYRSIVGLDLRTTDVIAGASAGATSKDPATFQAPGAAQVGDAPVTLFGGQALGQSTGTLDAGEAVRVMDVMPADDGVSDPVLEVETLDGEAGGWVDSGGLEPRDSAGPELWSMDGPDVISPNFDGYLDRLNLWARFSEPVSWSVKIKDANGDVVRTQDGSGHQAGITWDARAGGDPAPDGEYTWHLKADDAWGNPTLDEAGDFSIENEAVPGTAVLALEPNATTTKASTVTFTLTFAGPVTGLTKADFTRTGTARCDLGKPAGGPTVYTVTLSSCSTGAVTLTLASGSVADEAAQLGPFGAIASKVTIDRSDPSASAPRPTLRKGVEIGGGANAPLPLTLTWSGSDSGSGVASYDVRRSTDGGAWEKIASATTATSLDTMIAPSHAYRFMVRARDKAGNVGGWSGGWGWSPRLVQESNSGFVYTGEWTADSDPAHSAGASRFADASGASAKYTFSGRAVAWVTQLAPDSGEVAVYVDGELVTTVDTYRDATTARFVAFTRSWTSYGKHTIKLVVVGTADRPRIDLDALEVVG
jgi:hypothetical protein